MKVQNSIKPIRGTWICLKADDNRNRYTNSDQHLCTASQWRQFIDELAQMGMRYIVVLAVVHDGKAYYASESMAQGDEDLVAAVMEASVRHEMKVFLGVGWVKSTIKARQIIQELGERYENHPAFHGWYFPIEFSIINGIPNAFVDYVNALASEARKVTPRAKILISPYGMIGGQFDDAYIKQLKRMDVDIIAYQDEVGCVRERFPIPALSKNWEKLREAHRKVPRIALWANIESFTWENNANDRMSPLVPAAFPRLLAQMVAASPYVDEVISFCIQGMMQLPETNVPVGHSTSKQLWIQYKNFLDGKQQPWLAAAAMKGILKHDALGKTVKLKSPPSPKYSGRSLTNGVFANENYAHPEWMGFENIHFDATVDFGRKTMVKKIAIRFLHYRPFGILIPSWVKCTVSTDGKTFQDAGIEMLDPWPNDQHDAWIETWTSPELNEYVRYVRVQAKHSDGWIFVDEIMVNPKPDDTEEANSGEMRVP